nr:FeoC-like transcriptional regulator [Planosporangium thailandense]
MREIRSADSVSLDEVARNVGVSRGEVDAMVDYWVRRGQLTVEEIGRGCPGGGCGSCPSGNGDAPGCGSPTTGGPVLLAITIPTRRGPEAG